MGTHKEKVKRNRHRNNRNLTAIPQDILATLRNIQAGHRPLDHTHRNMRFLRAVIRWACRFRPAPASHDLDRLTHPRRSNKDNIISTCSTNNNNSSKQSRHSMRTRHSRLNITSNSNKRRPLRKRLRTLACQRT